MSEVKTMRLNKVLREFNISLDRAVEFLSSKGYEVESRPTTKISNKEYQVMFEEFQTDKSKKVASKEVGEEKRKEKEDIRLASERELEERKQRIEASRKVIKAEVKLEGPKTLGKIDLNTKKPIADKKETIKKEVSAPVKEEKVVELKTTKEAPKVISKEAIKIVKKEVAKEVPKIVKKEASAPVKKENPVVKKEEKSPQILPIKKETPAVKTVVTSKDPDVIKDPEKVVTQYKRLDGPRIIGEKIDLSQFKKPEKKKKVAADADKEKKSKRRRISKSPPKGARVGNQQGNRGGVRKKVTHTPKEEPSEADVQKQVRETLEKLQGKSSKGKGAKYRRDKRDVHRQKTEDDQAIQEAESKLLKVTEFVTVSEVATMMDVPVTQIISTCMSLGMMVTMNQRLDAETLTIVADEFDYEVEFITSDIEEAVQVEEDSPEDLIHRAPIVTVMGHVDHGKTSLLDYIRKENVIAGESGGITQHIGAYGVQLEGGQKIAFLDTPGHEAFTAMRARGAQVTDLVIVVVAADDGLMPQTKEAISHAQAANVPIVFAINKIDVVGANPDKIKEQLAAMDLLVEDWGGKIQSHDISAKFGTGVNDLLEKVLLEAEMLDLKANPDKRAIGTVVEAYLDKGRGFVSTILVQEGTLKVGDYVLAGKNSGKIKAMFDERGHSVEAAAPSTPVSILGLDGAPQAGDRFHVFEDEKEAKQIATKRSQLQREQSVRTQKHITLDEIGRRIALGDFKELNIILKGDVDGSVEALTDSFQKLSTEEIQVNIIHKGVGAITESDVLLASASEAIIIGFNVRPSGSARTIADQEEIDIRFYSIIYDAINDLRDAMEGMLSPEMKEEIVGNVEIREVYKISKIGNIAGCMVMSGKIMRNSMIRIIREDVVVHTGTLIALKRFKDDAKEVTKGYDCGIQIKGFNDIKMGDVIEAYEEVAIKKKLKK